MEWDGVRWAPDHGSYGIAEMALEILKAEADELPPFSKAKAAAETAISARKARMVVDYVETHRADFHVSYTALNAHPNLLNVTNGTVDLTTGVLSPHEPADLLTQIAGGAYLSRTYNPDVDKLTKELVPPDAVDWFQRLMGYATQGDITEELFVVFHGDGSNGKTTLVEVVKVSLGDYAAPGAVKVADRRPRQRAPHHRGRPLRHPRRVGLGDRGQLDVGD